MPLAFAYLRRHHRAVLVALALVVAAHLSLVHAWLTHRDENFAVPLYLAPAIRSHWAMNAGLHALMLAPLALSLAGSIRTYRIARVWGKTGGPPVLSVAIGWAVIFVALWPYWYAPDWSMEEPPFLLVGGPWVLLTAFSPAPALIAWAATRLADARPRRTHLTHLAMALLPLLLPVLHLRGRPPAGPMPYVLQAVLLLLAVGALLRTR